ncbi:MAG TPA: aminotransferase class V-fold PLP-dependent enzyme [Bryobacteraceae bacterium]|nr:aminotransferase class V-fold PLP-dependent enzyme [Bryobacteraceae bacterium]
MDEEQMVISRRSLIGPGLLASGLAGAKTAFAQSLKKLPGHEKEDGAYWQKVRKQFLFEPGFSYMNTGTVGATPGPVYHALVRYWRLMAENPNENSAVLQGRMEAIREKAAQFIGATAAEVAITRNATEGNNLLAKGVDLKAGDEVLIGYLEHDSNRQPWLLRAKRDGIKVTEVPVGTPPKNPEEILNAFNDAITPRTRILTIAQCDTVTGTFAPIRELGKLAHDKGLLFFVDGAQAIGQVPVNLRELGVDAWITTSHKWLASPAGTGLMYIRRDLQDRIWPNIVTENWWSFTDARRYDRLSRRPWPVLAALEDSLDFQLAIGKPRIESRIRALGSYLRAQAADIPRVRLYTSNDPRLSGALTSLSIDGVPPLRLREYLRQKFDMYVADRAKGVKYPADPHGVDGIRISTHYYNSFEQVEKVLQALRDMAA